MVMALEEGELFRLRQTNGLATTTILGHPINLANGGEFVVQYEQFFRHEMLRGIRPSIGVAPTLVDLGANIGTCTSWFKLRFPMGHVIAVEPDPTLALLLRRNMATFSNVEVIEAAAWRCEGFVDFHSDATWALHRADPSGAPHGRVAIRVRAIDVADILPPDVTLLKVNIDGAELEVLRRLEHRLSHGVNYIHVEVHELHGAKRRLPEVLGLLEAAGFDYHIAPLHVDPHPYLVRQTRRGVINPVAIFAWQPSQASRVEEVVRQ